MEKKVEKYKDHNKHIKTADPYPLWSAHKNSCTKKLSK